MHNPLRSEGDAFRWAVAIGIGAASVVAVTLLTRPVVGVLWAVAVLVFILVLAWRSSRGSLAGRTEVSRGGDGERRVLVLSSQADVVGPLLAEIESRAGGAEARSSSSFPPSRVRAPRAGPPMSMRRWGRRGGGWSSPCARSRAGLRARGQVGDPDPNVALEDALHVFAADEVIIAVLPPDLSLRLEHGVVERAREETDLPVTHVIVDPDPRDFDQVGVSSVRNVIAWRFVLGCPR